MTLVVISLVLGIIAIVMALTSAILFSKGSDMYGAIGVVSTIISTVLGFVSIIYTFISGNQTIKLLDNIDTKNNLLIEKIRAELVEKNFDEENLESLRERLQNK
ncbi:MAG: hypothetical protein ACI4GB_04285 [Acutalibacteraceae bacterium]